jgi:leucyl/phenylalanyl-tRNA--protein transferase
MADDEFDSGVEVRWYQPYRRALFPMTGLRLSRSMERFVRKNPFEIRFDTSYEMVMRSCLRPTDNWISEDLIRVYTQIYHEGWGHCAECWEDGELVGGVYGIALGGCFCAESMFHRRTNASKVALWALIEKCRSLGFQLFDAQLMNSHLSSLGAYEVPQAEYMSLLDEAMQVETVWGRFKQWDPRDFR